VWVDRTGRELRRLGDPDSAGSLDPSLSPDEQRVALYRTVNAQPDIWLLDTRRAVLSRFTTEGRALRPIWSPDGSEMVYAGGIPTNLFRRSVAGQADEHAILERVGRKPQRTGQRTVASFCIAATIRKPGGIFLRRDGQFSPDATWIAYQSNESGRFEITFSVSPGPARRRQSPARGAPRSGGARTGKNCSMWPSTTD
jgi:WD40-like Beta Propeller Repeat